MFIGHYAVAFAAKKAAPQTSLGTLFLGVQLADQLWPILLLLGVEHVRITPGITVMTPFDFYDYPFSHGLLALSIYAVVATTIYFIATNYKRGALILGICILSHWVLDVITHRPDMPLGFGNGMMFGIGLWNSWNGTVIVEGSLFLAGVIFYYVTTKSRDSVGLVGTLELVAFLALMYVVNIYAPPPPNVIMVAIGGNAGWLLILWAYWVDRHRTQRISRQSTLPTKADQNKRTVTE